MSRKSVRLGIQKYLGNANVPSVGSVFAYAPKITTEEAFFQMEPPGAASGSVIYIDLQDQSESRGAFGGATSGIKWRLYKVSLICFFRSKKPDAQDVGADNDAFLDGLIATIQASRTAGGAVFQWGEGDRLMGTDITVRSDMPRALRLQMTQVYSVVDVYALEQLFT